jgi:hypothetical protein
VAEITLQTGNWRSSQIEHSISDDNRLHSSVLFSCCHSGATRNAMGSVCAVASQHVDLACQPQKERREARGDEALKRDLSHEMDEEDGSDAEEEEDAVEPDD